MKWLGLGLRLGLGLGLGLAGLYLFDRVAVGGEEATVRVGVIVRVKVGGALPL